MKLKLQNNELWEKERKKKRNRQRRKVLYVILCMAALAGLIAWYITYTDSKSTYYPDLPMEQTLAKEPVTKTPQGYDQILRCPSIPYTMAVAGDILSQQEEGCVIKPTDDLLVAVYEIDTLSTTRESITEKAQKLLGACTITQYDTKSGYLNGRTLEYATATMETDGEKTYTMTMRLQLEEEKDILMLGITRKTSCLLSLQDELKKLFYTLHKLTQTELRERSEADGTRTVTMINQEGEETVYYLEKPQGEVSMENTEEGMPNVPDDGENHEIRLIEENVLYKEYMTQNVTIKEQTGKAYVVFQYSNTEVPLTMAQIESPQADKVILPVYENDQNIGVYAFQLDAPQAGDWTIRFSANDYIGYYYTLLFQSLEEFTTYLEQQGGLYQQTTGE